MEAGHYKRARTLVDSRYRAAPEDPHNLYLMARVKRAWGDTEASAQLLEKAVARTPSNAEYRSQLGQVYGEIAQKASMFRQMSLGRKCKKEIDAAVQLAPNHLEAQTTLMMFLDKAPGMMGGDKTEARALAVRILDAHGARGYMAQARIASTPAEREGLYRKAIAADPKYYNAHVALANSLLNAAAADAAGASIHARAAIEANPQRAPAYTLLAAALALQENWPELDRVLAASEKNVPDNLAAHHNAAGILARKGRELARAESYVRKYLAQEPEAGAPSHAVAHSTLARILEKQGRKPEAVASLREALRLQPGLEDAKKDLNRLRKN